MVFKYAVLAAALLTLPQASLPARQRPSAKQENAGQAAKEPCDLLRFQVAPSGELQLNGDAISLKDIPEQARWIIRGNGDRPHGARIEYWEKTPFLLVAEVIDQLMKAGVESICFQPNEAEQALKKQATIPAPKIKVRVNRDGRTEVTLDGSLIAVEELGTALEYALQSRSEKTVSLWIGEEASWSVVAQVIDAARKARAVQ
jgi:biopolymer transport protein ExbD